MTFEPGDRVKSKGNDWATVEVLAVHGDRFWGLGSSGSGPLTYESKNFEKIEPFFEVGKSYAGYGFVFRPVRVDKGSRGERYAYGERFNRTSGSTVFGIETIFSADWTEEAGDIPFEG